MNYSVPERTFGFCSSLGMDKIRTNNPFGYYSSIYRKAFIGTAVGWIYFFLTLKMDL